MSATTVRIERQTSSKPTYRAITGTHQSIGQSAGEALDSLNAQLGPTDSSSLFIIQQIQSDMYFSEAQYLRMQELMGHPGIRTLSEQAELEELVRNELIGSAKRTSELADAMGL